VRIGTNQFENDGALKAACRKRGIKLSFS